MLLFLLALFFRFPPESRSRKADPILIAESTVRSRLIYFIRQYSRWKTSEAAIILRNTCTQIRGFIVVVPGGLLEIHIAVYDRQVELLSKFCGVGALAPDDGVYMRCSILTIRFSQERLLLSNISFCC